MGPYIDRCAFPNHVQSIEFTRAATLVLEVGGGITFYLMCFFLLQINTPNSLPYRSEVSAWSYSTPSPRFVSHSNDKTEIQLHVSIISYVGYDITLANIVTMM